MAAGQPHGEEAPRCKAKAKTTGARCRQPAAPGFKVCRVHGGATPVGIASAAFKHGRYSRHLPHGLVALYEERLADPDILSLHHDIALLDARQATLLTELRTAAGQQAPAWDEAGRAFELFSVAMRLGNVPEMERKLGLLGDVLTEGAAETRKEEACWERVLDVVEQKRKLVESERKRLLEGQQYIAVDRLMVLVAALIDAVRRHVEDRHTLAAISTEIGRLVPTSP
jgi:hypothetical protein